MMLSYLFKAVTALALCWLLAQGLSTPGLWMPMLAVLLFSVPVALSGIYISTVEQTRRLSIFKRGAILLRLQSGRWLRVLFWLLYALISAFPVLLQFHLYSPLEWALLFLVIPLFWLLYRVFLRLLGDELRPVYLTQLALRYARRACPLLMLPLVLTLVPWLGETPIYEALGVAVEEQDVRLENLHDSALFRALSVPIAFVEGAKAYTLGRLGGQGSMLALILTLGAYSLAFYNICALLSCFLIPRQEYRRILSPLREADQLPPLRRSVLATWVTVLTIGIVFVYPSLFAALELWARQRLPESLLQAPRTQWVQRLERVEEAWYQEGTLARIEEARLALLSDQEATLRELEQLVDEGFARLANNVDPFLDWYYSLGGEYTRLARLLAGDIEAYLQERLREALESGEPFADLQAALDLALKQELVAAERYRAAVHKILEQSRVQRIPGVPVVVLRESAQESLLMPPLHEDLIGLEQRLLASGGGSAAAGVVSALVVKKVMSKLAGKGVVKLAAKSLSKLAAGKAVGGVAAAGAGAATGALAGSVVPGLGTAVGAAIGGFLGGLAIGVGVDKALIELEEALNRESFRAAILEAIEEAHLEFKAQLRAPVGA